MKQKSPPTVAALHWVPSRGAAENGGENRSDGQTHPASNAIRKECGQMGPNGAPRDIHIGIAQRGRNAELAA